MAEKPTVGRIVHFVNAGHSLGTYNSTCRAAIVSDIKNGTTVSCAVFTPRGTLFYEDLTYDEGNAGGTWHWPERDDQRPTSSITPVGWKPPAKETPPDESSVRA